MTETADILVVGGGLVGAAVAYGLSRDAKVVVLDEGDVAFRASRGNFGLVWVQSKGDGAPPYAAWTRRSADLWPDFSDTLFEETGVATAYEKTGGLHFALSEADLDARKALVHRMHDVHGAEHYGARILDRAEVDEMMSGLGPDVVGATFCPHDGHTSPLYLLRALHAGIVRNGGRLVSDAKVEAIEREGGDFRVLTGQGAFSAAKVVLAAGLGNRPLGAVVGLSVPVKPIKGQILVTERMAPRLRYATHVVRQTAEGSVMIGDSQEDVGFDLASTTPVMSEIAARAVRMFPFLKDLRVVRAWAALRVMSEDGLPIYQESESHPGAFTINCHSGVTLAAAHAMALAPMIAGGGLGLELDAFAASRFEEGHHGPTH